MYTTYSTPAIVFSRAGVGEGDLVVDLFTRDFGLIRARAAGARAESSKLRYVLQTLAIPTVALVRGKHGWRLTGAEYAAVHQDHSQNTIHIREYFSDAKCVARTARIILLTRSLLAPEEASDMLYNLLSRHITYLDSDAAELALVAAILTVQGFLRSDTDHSDIFATWHAQAETSRTTVLTLVNAALAANHIAQK